MRRHVGAGVCSVSVDATVGGAERFGSWKLFLKQPTKVSGSSGSVPQRAPSRKPIKQSTDGISRPTWRTVGECPEPLMHVIC